MQISTTRTAQHLRFIIALIGVIIIAFTLATFLPTPVGLMLMLVTLLTVYAAGLIYVRRITGR